jgi:predicted Zn-dependent peptidase
MDFITSLESSSSISNIYGDYFAKGNIDILMDYEEKINSLDISQIEGIKKYFDKKVEIYLHS